MNTQIQHVTNLCLANNKMEEEVKSFELICKLKLKALGLGGNRMTHSTLLKLLQGLNKQ